MIEGNGAAQLRRPLQLRLTHAYGHPRHATLLLPGQGLAMDAVLALGGSLLSARQVHSVRACRIEPMPGGWQLRNASGTLVCALNRRRILQGQICRIAPGDALEVELLRLVVEHAEPGRPPATDSAEPLASSASGTPPMSFDLRELADAQSQHHASYAARGSDLLVDLLDPAQQMAEMQAADWLHDLLSPAQVDGQPPAPAAAAQPLAGMALQSPPDDDVLRQLGDEFQRVVLDPTQLQSNRGWMPPRATEQSQAPDIERLRHEADGFPLLRDILLPRANVDSAMAGMHTLGNDASLTSKPVDEDVLALFAPELARRAKAHMPELTRKEHHALAPDSPMSALPRSSPHEESGPPGTST